MTRSRDESEARALSLPGDRRQGNKITNDPTGEPSIRKCRGCEVQELGWEEVMAEVGGGGGW